MHAQELSSITKDITRLNALNLLISFINFQMFFELILNVERDQDPFELIRLQTIGGRIMWIAIKGHNAFSIQNHSLSYLTQNGVNLHMYVCM